MIEYIYKFVDGISVIFSHINNKRNHIIVCSGEIWIPDFFISRIRTKWFNITYKQWQRQLKIKTLIRGR